MSLKLQLVKGSRVIYEMPLDINNWTREEIRDELGLLEREIGKVRAIHEMFSNETRIRMLNSIIRNMDVRFSELMDQLDVNQKIVNENLERLRDRHLVNRHEKNAREVHYTASKLGFGSFLAMAAIRRVMDELETE
jgi:DNA-binding HxlR family transcriptional regulator